MEGSSQVVIRLPQSGIFLLVFSEQLSLPSPNHIPS